MHTKYVSEAHPLDDCGCRYTYTCTCPWLLGILELLCFWFNGIIHVLDLVSFMTLVRDSAPLINRILAVAGPVMWVDYVKGEGEGENPYCFS